MRNGVSGLFTLARNSCLPSAKVDNAGKDIMPDNAPLSALPAIAVSKASTSLTFALSFNKFVS